MNKIWYAIGDSFDYLFAMADYSFHGLYKSSLGETPIPKHFGREATKEDT